MSASAPAAVLEARGLGFRYERSAPLLFEVDFCVHPGEIVALTGPSGRGKSTLLYLLGLLVHPTRGEVLVSGCPTSALGDAARARLRSTRLGFVFQDAALDATRTVLDNVIETSLYRGEARQLSVQRALALLERFGVQKRASSRPGQISGGQAQRIALCRALLNDPSIVLADEPTGNLDRASAAVVLDAFRERAAGGAAVLIATHDPVVVAECDRRVQL